jgi:hypothetical protein
MGNWTFYKVFPDLSSHLSTMNDTRLLLQPKMDKCEGAKDDLGADWQKQRQCAKRQKKKVQKKKRSKRNRCQYTKGEREERKCLWALDGNWKRRRKRSRWSEKGKHGIQAIYDHGCEEVQQAHGAIANFLISHFNQIMLPEFMTKGMVQKWRRALKLPPMVDEMGNEVCGKREMKMEGSGGFNLAKSM